MAHDVRLTTADNPFNPFTQWDEWLAYDIAKGHFSFALLARVARTSNGLSSTDNEQAIEDAIDEIIAMHPEISYKKVYRED